MAALEDAASGRAQVRKGSQLDIPVDELASTVVLEDGEVLKLPPTPDMTSGREHESDPETEVVIRRSRPTSSAGPSGAFAMHERDAHNRSAPPTAPPPLPPRHPRRSDEHTGRLSMDELEPVSKSVGGSPRVPPALPPRSRARPQSAVISPTSLAFTTTDSEVPVEGVGSGVPADSPPSYDEARVSPGPSSAPLVDTTPAVVAPEPSFDGPHTMARDDTRTTTDSIANLNLGALDSDAPAAQNGLMAPAIPNHVFGAPEPSPALTFPHEDYSLGPSPNMTRIHSSAPSGPEGANGGQEEMSESERREWEQHFAAQREAAEAAQKEAAQKAKEDESLL